MARDDPIVPRPPHDGDPITPSLRISCVVPTHDRDGMLETAVRSILAQTLPASEIIVVDDLGRDSTRALVESIAAEADHPLVYVDGSDASTTTAGASRNRGAEVATGELLAFLDDDDYWQPGFLAAAHALLVADSRDFVVAWTRFQRDEKFAPGLSMPAGLDSRTGLSRSGLTGSNGLVTTSAFHGIGGFDPALKVLNDFDYLRRLLANGSRYSVVEERLVTQVSHDLGHLSTRSLGRAEVIRSYVRANSSDLSRGDHRHLTRLMHASSRGADQTGMGRIRHSVMQARYTVPSEFVAGVVRRVRTGLGMYH